MAQVSTLLMRYLACMRRRLFLIYHFSLDSYTGKTTLVERLKDSLHCTQHKTPSGTFKTVRAFFDNFGGPLARAYYMCSNYHLVYELHLHCKQKQQSFTFVIDRFYSSTAAYTIGGQTTGEEEDINAFYRDCPELFIWPHDLSTPDVILLLEADEDVRMNRLSRRVVDPDVNEYDELLRKYKDLGKRINRCIKVLRHVDVVDANKNADEVLREAKYFVSSHNQYDTVV